MSAGFDAQDGRSVMTFEHSVLSPGILSFLTRFRLTYGIDFCPPLDLNQQQMTGKLIYSCRGCLSSSVAYNKCAGMFFYYNVIISGSRD